MSKPTARVLALLDLLQAGRVRSVAELAERLDVHERTVRRDVAHLLDLHIPVESLRGRYGGYRLLRGYRLPPLMLTDDEALAVLLGLIASARAGLSTTVGVAGETAQAKIQRVLPHELGRKLDAVLEALTFTTAPSATARPSVEVLLTVADAVQHSRPLALAYTDGERRRSNRTFHPYGLVFHSRRWYVPGLDSDLGQDRTLRLDRIDRARALPGAFIRPTQLDPAQQVLSGLARAPYRHEVHLRIQAAVPHIRTKLPASVAVVEELTGTTAGPQPWVRVVVHAERLDWIPPLLAALDRPFVIEQPTALQELMVAFIDRLAASAHGSTAQR